MSYIVKSIFLRDFGYSSILKMKIARSKNTLDENYLLLHRFTIVDFVLDMNSNDIIGIAYDIK